MDRRARERLQTELRIIKHSPGRISETVRSGLAMTTTKTPRKYIDSVLRWQARKAAAGLCICCGKQPRSDTSKLCIACREKMRALCRKIAARSRPERNEAGRRYRTLPATKIKAKVWRRRQRFR